MTDKKPKKPTKSFSELQTELEQVILALQQEETDIDQAVLSYEEGLKLIDSMTDYLEQAGTTITALKNRYEPS